MDTIKNIIFKYGSSTSLLLKIKNMQQENRQFSESGRNHLKKEIAVSNHRKDNTKSLVSLIGILTLLGLWIILCFATNLFINEALICSSVIAGLVLMSFADQNGVSRKYVKNY
jgi:ABC-type bacteriocin/lantibiotic exporter with double-glycine peptidase domain